MKEKQNLAAAAQDCMAYLPGMEVIESDILREVQCAADSVDFNAFTERDVKAALMRKHKTVQDFAALLSPAALPFLEEMAQQEGSLPLNGSARHAAFLRRCTLPITAKITACIAALTAITKLTD